MKNDKGCDTMGVQISRARKGKISETKKQALCQIVKHEHCRSSLNFLWQVNAKFKKNVQMNVTCEYFL